MGKRLHILVWIVVLVTVTSCSYARLGQPVSVPRGETVRFAWGDLEIRSCGYLREYLPPELGHEEWYNYLKITVDGKDRTIESSLDADVITVDGYEITIMEMEPEPGVMCTVIVERIK